MQNNLSIQTIQKAEAAIWHAMDFICCDFIVWAKVPEHMIECYHMGEVGFYDLYKYIPECRKPMPEYNECLLHELEEAFQSMENEDGIYC